MKKLANLDSSPIRAMILCSMVIKMMPIITNLLTRTRKFPIVLRPKYRDDDSFSYQ